MSVSIHWPKNIPDPVPLPKNHRHESDVEFPVIGFDFNDTLTPAEQYPIEAGPFPGVKEVLETFKGRGCCLHVMTSGLYYGGQDAPVFRARQRALQAWGDQYEIPIDFWGGKVPSDCYWDNDFINVPKGDPDWLKIGEQIEAGLKSRFALVDGTYRPLAHAPIGRPMPEPIPEVQELLPRGYTTPRLDIDFHKTLFSASSSTRQSPPRPAMATVLRELYNANITIRLSCAGWSPLTHPRDESAERYQGLVWQCAQYDIPYDRIVTKDFHHVGVDDKGVTANGDVERELPQVLAMLKASDRKAPSLQWNA